ncbi:hypothetical protein RHMOL_Rhmol12G0127100 [Rhododendron molle]|uniref:Uncharacterized protein n=1 Tax=Rhododendron molle TaxID=49168 RepID=A0ACC0LHT2_RHOML|nr:hypothetical protein RHMOL_Rhmol12G0127100 [Rhododendron molle]
MTASTIRLSGTELKEFVLRFGCFLEITELNNICFLMDTRVGLYQEKVIISSTIAFCYYCPRLGLYQEKVIISDTIAFCYYYIIWDCMSMVLSTSQLSDLTRSGCLFLTQMELSVFMCNA